MEKDGDENGEGSATMSKGKTRDAPMAVSREEFMRLAAGAIMQRNFSHNLGLNIIDTTKQ